MAWPRSRQERRHKGRERNVGGFSAGRGATTGVPWTCFTPGLGFSFDTRALGSPVIYGAGLFSWMCWRQSTILNRLPLGGKESSSEGRLWRPNHLHLSPPLFQSRFMRLPSLSPPPFDHLHFLLLAWFQCLHKKWTSTFVLKSPSTSAVKLYSLFPPTKNGILSEMFESEFRYYDRFDFVNQNIFLAICFFVSILWQ